MPHFCAPFLCNISVHHFTSLSARCEHYCVISMMFGNTSLLYTKYIFILSMTFIWHISFFPKIIHGYISTHVHTSSWDVLNFCHMWNSFNLLTPNDPYSGRTAPLTSKRYILYIYSTNICTEYFKHGIYSPFLSLKNAVCFIILTYLVPVLFTFYIQGVLKLKIIPEPKG